jgi:lysophospholipase L1-like esterase
MKMRARLDEAAQVQPGERPHRSLTLVALGDSIPAAVPRDCGCTAGYVALYGRALARATRRPVIVDNRAVPGSTSSDLRAAVAGDESLRAALAGADAVIVTVGHNDTPWVRSGGSAELLRHNLDAVLGEIRALRRDRPTLLRVTNFHNDKEGNPAVTPGGDAMSKRVVDLYARVICAVAARHHVPCADVYHAFNGPSGRSFDGRFVARDRIHPNQRGHRVIATLLIKLGFAPLAR